MEDVKERLLEWFSIKGLSDMTIKNYMVYYRKFIKGPYEKDWISRFVRQNNNLVARAFLKNFMQFCRVSEGMESFKELFMDYVIPAHTGRRGRKLPKVLNIGQVNSIAMSMNSLRNKLMLLITFYGGLRLDELLKITPYDFLWDNWMEEPEEVGSLKVLGKNKKQRYVFIPGRVMEEIYHWIKEEVSRKQGKDEPIFQISGRRWQEILSRASKKAIGYSINPHLLRHSISTYLLGKGWNIAEISEYLGHSSLNTTRIYLHVDNKQLRDKFSGIFDAEH